MSGPASEGRLSASSSEPSATSSRTLNSRHSGTYGGGGEGSSSQRPRLSSRQNSEGADAPSRDSGPRAEDSVQGRDFAQHSHRQQRNRRSGGFLLDSAFGNAPRTRHSHHESAENPKAKRRSHHSQPSDNSGHEERVHRGNGTASGSSPLSRHVRTADQDAENPKLRTGPANVHEKKTGELRVAKTRNSMHEMPATAQHGAGESEGPATPMIDPTQLVHMALNLSESRKRNSSAGLILNPQSRVPSGVQQDGSFRHYGTGSSLRQYLNEQRRVSRNISPGGRASPSGLRHMSASMQRSGSMALPGQPIELSPGTLARRDKFRTYIELKVEYLRLLESLPPLKPDANAPGNFTFSATNVPGSPQAQLTRTPSYAGKQYDLGRPYNPLQYIRNRRSRARERKTLDHEPAEFLNIDETRDWVDRVEKAARNVAYRKEDLVSLPNFQEGHQREAGPSKPPRLHMGWVFAPEELLADAHWLEQEDNKTSIEDRHGYKIFPPKPKEAPKQDSLQARVSKEYSEKRRKSWVEGLPGVAGDHATGDESENGSERGRKRRLLPALRAESPKHKISAWGNSRQHSPHYSDTSDSDSGSRKMATRKSKRVVDINNNTGPLEIRMRELLEKEAEVAQAKSPSVISPDTPDKWGREHGDVPANKEQRSSLDASGHANGSIKPESHWGFKMPPKRRTNASLSVDSSREPRSSFEGYNSTAPNTPFNARFPHIGSDLSPPPSRGESVQKKTKKSKFDMFRSEDSGKSHKNEHIQEPESATSDKRHNSRQASEDPEDGNGFSNTILSAPGAMKQLLHRKTDSVSDLQSPDKETRKDTKDSKDPSSAVHRFFKGVKSEGSKVGEFIFRRDRPPEDSDSDDTSDGHTVESDSDYNTKSANKTRPLLSRNTSAPTVGGLPTQEDSNYHLDLPSFRPAKQSGTDADMTYASDTNLADNHIARQARARANSRSPRFDKLAPPRMDLQGLSSTDSNGLMPTQSNDYLSKILARPGGVPSGLPPTALGNGRMEASSRQRSTSRPALQDKRHWSIADDDSNVLHLKTTSDIVTQADVARVRALFLCSGVKAKEISQRADTTRDPPPPFLLRAAKSINAHPKPVKRTEEHVLAAKILVNDLEHSTQTLHSAADSFRKTTVKDLTSMITSLKSHVESEIFARVRESGDEAVRITSEISGAAPLEVKQVTDEIDKMIRIRRRRMRWVRRVGWTVLEWMLLGAMWWIWLIVFILGLFRRVFGAGWGVVKWLLWI